MTYASVYDASYLAVFAGPVVSSRVASPTLAAVYRDHVDFVRAVARQLGVEEGQVDDVTHDVFLIVHRRLREFDGRASMRAWLYGIVRRIVMHHHRGAARARHKVQAAADARAPSGSHGLEDAVAGRQAARLVDEFLAELDVDKRLVFSLADIEGLTAPEIAELLDVKLNTVYSRLRVARQRFETFIRRTTGERGESETAIAQAHEDGANAEDVEEEKKDASASN